MRILSVTAQKPDSTGSGTYLAETVRCMIDAGHQTAVVCGIARDDATPLLPAATRVFPVRFDTEALPFHVCGMSDAMPYPSTRYRDLTPGMADRFARAFAERVAQAVEEFRPDLVVCHHLYLVTAVVREVTRALACAAPVVAVCHSTDLRQLASHGLARERIVAGVRGLDAILALHDAQRDQIVETFGVDASLVRVVGAGYNARVFMPAPLRLVFAGKVCRKKGVLSLLEAIDRTDPVGGLELRLAGGHSDEGEYASIVGRAGRSRWPVTFLGRLDPGDLAREYRAADVFVLPSFFEGLPLVAVEALACGCVDMLTELPGVRPWLERNAPGAPVAWVPAPRMRGVDEPLAQDLPAFEARLADAIGRADALARPRVDVTHLSWEGVTARIVQAGARA